MALARILLSLLLLPSACGIPRDPENTLERIEKGTLRVGVTDNPPWVDLSGATPTGIEVALAEELADRLRAEIEWVEGSESELADALHLLELDLLIGGLTSESPVAQLVTLTHPYYTTHGPDESDQVMAVANGENAWLTHLERFLLENAALVDHLVEDATP